MVEGNDGATTEGEARNSVTEELRLSKKEFYLQAARQGDERKKRNLGSEERFSHLDLIKALLAARK